MLATAGGVGCTGRRVPLPCVMTPEVARISAASALGLFTLGGSLASTGAASALAGLYGAHAG